MRCESAIGSEGGEEDPAHRDNTLYAQRDEDEAVFKKPKPKVSLGQKSVHLII